MFRRLLQSSSPRNGAVLDEFHRDQEARADIAASPSTPAPKPETPVAAAIPYDSFDGIYQAAPANQPRAVYTILKVIEMLNSPHLSGMGPEAKRGSLLMALAAVGAETTDILHDAMLRQRALNEYEEAQQRKLAAFEAAKAEENRTIQAELEQIKSEFVTRIQANISQVASCQDAFRIWQKTKQKELNAIADAATYCAPAESRTDNRTEGRAETMASVFDHAAAGRM